MNTTIPNQPLDAIPLIPGMRDVMQVDPDPLGIQDEYDRLAWIRDRILGCFERYGYRGIDLPIMENADLYRRKSGLEVMKKMYEFVDPGGRDVCLRPEMTASAARAYLASATNLPRPIRWSYVGPAFRYDRPQKARYRQFTQIGVELIGSESVVADAEMVAMACDAMGEAGLRSYEVHVGHMGLVGKFLESLDLSEREISEFIANLEESAGTSDDLEQFPLRPDAGSDNTSVEGLEGPVDNSAGFLSALQKVIDGHGNEAAPVVTATLSALATELYGSRTKDEIAKRLMRKVRNLRVSENSEKAQRFLKDLRKMKGEPSAVFLEMKHLTDRYGLDESPVRQLEQAVRAMESYGLDMGKIVIDFGFSRGLEYYTGLIFEINCAKLGAQKQVCGGGRYDGLIQLVGGRARVPACGFAFGLERLLVALALEGESDSRPQSATKRPEVLVVYLDDHSMAYAAGVAKEVRDRGVRVEFGLAAMHLRDAFARSSKLDVPFMVVVGENERESGTVSARWEEADGKRQQVFSRAELGELSSLVLRRRNGHG